MNLLKSVNRDGSVAFSTNNLVHLEENLESLTEPLLSEDDVRQVFDIDALQRKQETVATYGHLLRKRKIVSVKKSAK